MRKMWKRGRGYRLMAAMLAVFLGGMGSAYASWTDRLESRMHLDTDQFRMVVSGRTEPAAYLLDAEGEIAEEVSVVLTGGAGTKQAGFRIPDGVLAEMLSLGGSLRLEFPLDCEAAEDSWKVGASAQEENGKLEPEQVLFLSGGEALRLPDEFAEPFTKPVPCRVRTEAQVREDGNYGIVTVSPAEAGAAVLESWPDTLRMREETWNQLTPADPEYQEFQLDPERSDGEMIGTDTGVAVVYSLQCSLWLGQPGAVEEAEQEWVLQ